MKIGDGLRTGGGAFRGWSEPIPDLGPLLGGRRLAILDRDVEAGQAKRSEELCIVRRFGTQVDDSGDALGREPAVLPGLEGGANDKPRRHAGVRRPDGATGSLETAAQPAEEASQLTFRSCCGSGAGARPSRASRVSRRPPDPEAAFVARYSG